MTYLLSLLDKSPVATATDTDALAATIALAEAADRLGYHRYWLAEHHGFDALASAAPELLVAHLLARTRALRIGTGGILLQHYSPYKVAEIASVLSHLGPGRVDIGIGKAPGGLPQSIRALQSERLTPRDFNIKLAELDGWLKGRPSGAELRPAPRQGLELFLLGASPDSAQRAADLGWGYVHAGHHDGDADSLRATLALHAGGKGASLLSVTAFAAPSRSEAEQAVVDLRVYRLQLPGGQAVNLGSLAAAEAYAAESGAQDYSISERRPRIVAGTGEDIHEELASLQRDHGVREFILDIPVADAARRLRSIQLIARARQRRAA
ncbi:MULTISPECIES: MsnO8 family LLM class oxidoreductase [unclassified Haematobacter]|uniref:MsnO8 family LLM class oxidoreductase n=1 Tax=unclassified Haematobacter TaxID=2640585 RepID=UPI0025BF1A52|nr:MULTISPECIES: MsnO8 family LLM class oxidoreductase [unclassified Haematobacter]